MNKKQEISRQAIDIVDGELTGQNRSPENSFGNIANFWGDYLQTTITPIDVANMMILLKVARNMSGVYKEDNWVDICGYAANGGEIESKTELTKKRISGYLGNAMNKPE